MGYQNFLAAAKDKPNSNLYLVRHTESEGNTLGADCIASQDTPLTDRGREVAAALGDWFKDEAEIGLVLASEKERAIDTATLIAKAQSLEVATVANLVERQWGEFADKKWADLADRLDGYSIEERYTFVPEGGESWQQMENRLFVVLAEAVEQVENGKDIVVVTHNGALRALLPILAQTGIESHQDYSVQTGSIAKYILGSAKLEYFDKVIV